MFRSILRLWSYCFKPTGFLVACGFVMDFSGSCSSSQYDTQPWPSGKPYQNRTSYGPSSQQQPFSRPFQRRQCGLPNVLPVYRIEPERQRGYHYGYLTLQPSTVVNPVNIYTIFADSRTLFPGTGAPTAVEWSIVFQYPDAKPETQCEAQYGPYYVSVDGEYFGFYFDSSLNNDIVPDEGYYLYDDYDTVEIYANCYEVDRRTGICANPSITVNTRIRPDEMSARDRQRVNDIVESVVGPYCYSVRRFSEYTWTKSKPICTTPGPPACYASFENGIRNSIKNRQFVSKYE